MKSLPRFLFLGVVFFVAAKMRAADIHVNNVDGNDLWDGLSKLPSPEENRGPLRTIAKAIALARPGDTIHLEATDAPYREEVSFRDKGGEPGRPITVDGHGAIFDGSEPCPAVGWKKVSDTLWRLEGVYSRNGLVVDDRLLVERKYAPDLQPGEFCFENTQFETNVLFFRPPADRRVPESSVQVVWAGSEPVTLEPAKWKGSKFYRYKLPRAGRPERVLLDGVEAPLKFAKDHLLPGQWCMDGKDLTFSPPPGKEPSQLAIRKVVRGTGVSLAGKFGHVTIKNMNVRFVWNDAYNIHGEVTDAVFLNCNARDCFDEGFSSHDRCETVLDGAVFERCDNGVFNVNESGWSVTRNLVVRESRDYGFGVAVVDSQARHWLSNAVLENNPIPLIGRYLEAYNVKVSGGGGRLSLVGPLVFDQVTVEGDSVKIEVLPGSGPVEIFRSAFVPSVGEIVFTKATDVRLDAVVWSPRWKVFPKPEGESLPLPDWLAKLGPNAVNSSALAEGAQLPEGMGFREAKH